MPCWCHLEMCHSILYLETGDNSQECSPGDMTVALAPGNTGRVINITLRNK